MSHFTAVGFPADTPEDMESAALTVLANGTRADVGRGIAHVDWTGGSGAGFDVVLSAEGIECTKPTFRGAPGARVRAGRWIADPQCEWCSPLWLEVLGETGYPAVVEVDDMALVRRWLRKGAVYDVALTVFVEENDVAGDDLATRAAVPVGTFGETPYASMLVSGDVLSAERRVNELTGAAFGHARIASLDAEYDLVHDPHDPLPAVGSVARAAGWVVAHVEQPATRAKWWRR